MCQVIGSHYSAAWRAVRQRIDHYSLYHGLNGLNGLNGVMSYGGKKRSKSLLLSLGLRPCSPMRMLSHVSELPCPTLHIRLVCPQADRKPTKQNSCRWQYKISLQRRLLTITSDLPGASHQAKDIVVAPGEPFCTANGSYFVFWGLRRSCRAGLGVAALGCCQDAS